MDCRAAVGCFGACGGGGTPLQGVAGLGWPRPIRRSVGIVILGATALALGCVTEPSKIIPASVVSVATASAGPLVVRVDVELDVAASIEIDYWTAGVSRLRVEAEPAATHTTTLTRLVSESVYDFEVRTVAPDGARGEAYRGQFFTDPLPDGLAEIQFTGRGMTTEPLLMLELSNADPAAFSGFVIIDSDATVVWYRSAGFPTGWIRRDNGNFVLLDWDVGLIELTPDHQVVAELATTPERFIHHDVQATEQNTVLFIAQRRQVVDDTLWVGEAIWEWDPDRGSEVMRWNAFDALSPRVDRGPRSRPDDWLHFNSLRIGARGNVIVSSPFLDQVLSIEAGFQSIEWRLGGVGHTLQLRDDAVFSGQHDASELGTGRLILFDNGVARVGGESFSRALELQVDLPERRTSKLWEFRPQPDNHAIFVGSARRLANGNTVVAFGVSGSLPFGARGIEVNEVTESGRVVFHLQVGGPSTLYRATPLAAVAAEYVVPDP